MGTRLAPRLQIHGPGRITRRRGAKEWREGMRALILSRPGSAGFGLARVLFVVTRARRGNVYRRMHMELSKIPNCVSGENFVLGEHYL